MLRNLRVVLLMLAAFSFASSGCATIFSGTRQNISVQSEPPGAYVQIGDLSSTTPCILAVRKGRRLDVVVTHNSETKTVPLSRRFDAVSLLNIFVWPGFIVDAISGSIVKYHPKMIHVDFTNQIQPTS